MTQLQKPRTTLVVAALFTLLALPARATTLSSINQGASAIETHAQHTETSLLAITSELQAPAPAPSPKRRHKRSARHHLFGRMRRTKSLLRRRSGGNGFSYEKMEVASTTPEVIKSVVDHGQELLGIRYRSSGIAKWPLDCSGFVSYIYSLEGFKIPHSSRDLSVYTKDIQNPQPGDLLFFKGTNRRSNRVGHVAMVISNEDGDIKMLHSSCSRGIVIESLNNSPYYTSRYVGAGRLPEVKEHWKGIPHELDVTE